MYGIRRYGEMGGILSNPLNQLDMCRRMTFYVDRILKGVKPADLPVENALILEWLINLKTT
jgi:putative ABC transport system substrate-binding protein